MRSTMPQPHFKLTYFDIEGLGEPIRLAFALAHIDFEDERISFSDWPLVKSMIPYGQLPVLTINHGPPRAQSGAILRFVGTLKESLLSPPDKQFDIDEAIGIVMDLHRSWMPNFYISMYPEMYGYPEGYGETTEGKEKVVEMRQRWVAQELPKHLSYLSNLLERNGSKWLCGGGQPTIADCLCVTTLRAFTHGMFDHVPDDCIEQHNPKLADYVRRFCALPEIQGRYKDGLGAATAQ